MKTLFVSDLHLDPAAPEVAAQFVDFLRGEARGASALYVLGDLFEAWIGDDDPGTVGREVAAELRALVDAGTPCWIMHGNRDFLIGERFCRESGARLLADGTVIEVHGERVLLMHGDVLCTDDRSYQRLRRILRNPIVLWLLTHLSLKQRRKLAQRLRAGSQMHTGSTAPEIMDVNAEAVEHALRAAGVRTLVHGHTHRPAVHELALDGARAQRIVLGDWYAQGSVLEWSPGGIELRALPRPRRTGKVG